MKMEESYSNELYRVLSVTANAGEAIPLHHATSDAFIIAKQGKGKITFTNREVILAQGDTLLIKANEEHKMDILEDFSSCIILSSDGKIDFGNH